MRSRSPDSGASPPAGRGSLIPWTGWSNIRPGRGVPHVLSFVLVVTVVVLAVTPRAAAPQSTDDRSIQEARDEVTRLDQERTDVLLDLAEARREAERLQDDVDELERELDGEASQALRNARAWARAAHEEVRDLLAEAERRAGELRRARNALRDRLLRRASLRRNRAEGLLAAARVDQAVEVLAEAARDLDELARLRRRVGPVDSSEFHGGVVPGGPVPPPLRHQVAFYEGKVAEGEALRDRLERERERMAAEREIWVDLARALDQAGRDGAAEMPRVPLVDEHVEGLDRSLEQLDAERDRVESAMDDYRNRIRELERQLEESDGIAGG